MKFTASLMIAGIAAGALGIGFAAGNSPPADTTKAQPVAALDGAAATHPSGVAANKDKSKLSKFMRAKLKASEGVLDGLVTEDYAKIQKGAETMIVMSKAADWQVVQGPTYAQYSSEFRRAAERLAKRGNAKQLDSAALAYMHVTMTCINCHKYVKNAKVAQGEPLSPGLRFALRQNLQRLASPRRERRE